MQSAQGTGGMIIIRAGRLFSSGQYQATGPHGGQIAFQGADLALVAARVDIRGTAGGGTIQIGTHDPATQRILVTAATTLAADAEREGPGGTISIWAGEKTEVAGTLTARGGLGGGVGGQITISTPGTLRVDGQVDAGAPAGRAGTLWLDPKNITIGSAGVFPQYQLINPTPNAGDQFGWTIQPLSSGNVAVTDPGDDSVGTDAGAVYLYQGRTGALLSTLTGATASDRVGSNGAVVLANGNYVVRSPLWDNGAVVDAGAVTWGNGASGQTLDGSATITPQNSLIGQIASAGLGTLNEDTTNQTVLAPFANETGGRIAAGFTDPNLLTFARGQAQTITVTLAFLARTLNTGTAVILQASNDLTLADPLTVNNPSGAGGALTLQAGRSILLNASLTTDDGALILIANDRLANGVVDSQRDPGAAGIIMASGTSITAGSGSVTLDLRDGAGKTNLTSGVISLTTITAAALTVSNNGPTTGSDVLLHNLTLSGSASISATGAIEEAGADAGADITVPTLSLSAGSGIGSSAQLEIDATTLTNVTVSGAGVINLRDTAGGLTIGSATLGGAGTFDTGANPLTISTLLALGTNPLTLSGSTVSFAGMSTLQATITGSGAGQFGQLVVNGTLNLGNATLTVTGGSAVPFSTGLVLIANDGSDAVSGTFAGLPNSGAIITGGSVFLINYASGDGNDVVLTRGVLAFMPYVHGP